MAAPMPVIDIVAYSVDSVRHVQRGGMAAPCIHAGRIRIGRHVPAFPWHEAAMFFQHAKKIIARNDNGITRI